MRDTLRNVIVLGVMFNAWPVAQRAVQWRSSRGGMRTSGLSRVRIRVCLRLALHGAKMSKFKELSDFFAPEPGSDWLC